jgi:4-hydroxy-tetrahydrodipicolinate synthase
MRGITPPLLTPLTGRDALDVAGLERLLEHVIAGGVHGVFLLGSTGEGPSLGHRLRRELVERACRIVAGRIPVLVGVTDTAFTESVELARAAAEAGARAAVLSAPYYFPAGQPELAEYVERLVPELGLPVYLYNMPSLTKVSFGVETLRRAMQLPSVVGLKDSSGDLGYFREALQVARARPDWSVFMGPETLLAEAMPLGAQGGVPGGANLAPRLFVELYDAFHRGDSARVRELQERVVRISSTVYAVGKHGSAYLKGLKSALSLLGICEDFLAEPFTRFGAQDRRRVEEHLVELGLLTKPG